MFLDDDGKRLVAFLSGKVLLAEEILQMPLEDILLHGNLIGSRGNLAE